MLYVYICITYVLVKPWLFVVSVIYHTSEASVINHATPRSAMVKLTYVANVFPRIGAGGAYTG